MKLQALGVPQSPVNELVLTRLLRKEVGMSRNAVAYRPFVSDTIQIEHLVIDSCQAPKGSIAVRPPSS